MLNEISIKDATINYLATIRLARSANTARSYQNAMQFFENLLNENQKNVTTTPISQLTEDGILLLINGLKNHSPATERLYVTAIHSFFEYIVSEKLADINLPRLKLLIRQRTRRPGQRLPQFSREIIESIVEKAIQSTSQMPEDEIEKLRLLRDRSFIITLSDTGLRVHEACNLRRGDIDWFEGKAIIVGKGNKQGVIRFSSRSISAIKEYLATRAKIDSASGKPLASLPVFSRHDRGAGKKIKGMTPTTGRNIISEWFDRYFPEDTTDRNVSPHSFRHYFVTRILQSSGNLKLAQELARHSNIAVTQRYAHLSDNELDRGFHEAFDNSETKS